MQRTFKCLFMKPRMQLQVLIKGKLISVKCMSAFWFSVYVSLKSCCEYSKTIDVHGPPAFHVIWHTRKGFSNASSFGWNTDALELASFWPLRFLKVKLAFACLISSSTHPEPAKEGIRTDHYKDQTAFDKVWVCWWTCWQIIETVACV